MIAIVTAPELAQDVAGAELLLSRHAEHRVEIGSRSDALLALYKTGNTLISQCEKRRKKSSSLDGAFLSTHGKSIDDVDRSIVETRTCIEGSMPVHADSEEYNMNHARRGKAIIFNHDKFTMANMADRIGSLNDVRNLNAVFTNLGFEVFVYENLEWTKMESLLHNLSQEDHSDADCLVVIVLTHGLGPTYLVSGDVPYPVDSLWTPFTADKCVTLAGKPKLFFIQACRGDKLDGGLKLISRTQTDSGKSGYKIPTHADFLLAYSTFEGFFSFRHPENGTWFIQSLCEELKAHGTSMDLLKLLTRVSRRVAINFQSNNDSQPWFDEQKQVPSINSMLIREVYFRPKRPATGLWGRSQKGPASDSWEKRSTHTFAELPKDSKQRSRL